MELWRIESAKDYRWIMNTEQNAKEKMEEKMKVDKVRTLETKLNNQLLLI